MAIRTRLIEARQALHLTQGQLAEQMQVYQSTVSRIEKGELMPSADVAAKLIRILGVSLEDIVTEPSVANDPSADDHRCPHCHRAHRKPRRSHAAA